MLILSKTTLIQPECHLKLEKFKHLPTPDEIMEVEGPTIS